MTQAERIIEKFGGLTATARALNHLNPTTVQGWKERGFIPARQQPLVLDAARALGLDMTPADFFYADEAGVAEPSTPEPRKACS